MTTNPYDEITISLSALAAGYDQGLSMFDEGMIEHAEAVCGRHHEANGKAIVTAKRADLADKFWNELLDANEALTAIADRYGTRTLVDLMCFHQAILTDGHIDEYAVEPAVVEVLNGLESAETWKTFVKTEANAAYRP